MFTHLRPGLAAAAALFLLAATASAAEPTLTLKKGDRIVFLGDSITPAGVGPKGYVTLIRKNLQRSTRTSASRSSAPASAATKSPTCSAAWTRTCSTKSRPSSSSTSASTTSGTARRTRQGHSQGEIRGRPQGHHRPDHATGAGWCCVRRASSARRTTARTSLDARLDEYADISRTVAKELKVPLCDLRKGFQDYLKKNNPDNKESGHPHRRPRPPQRRRQQIRGRDHPQDVQPLTGCSICRLRLSVGHRADALRGSPR